MLSKCEGEFGFSEISFVACIALFVQKELTFGLNIAWVFLKHYIKMLSSTCIQCNNNFQYPMLLLILNSFFLCFNSFLLYLQTLLILFKVYHACILVYHGVPTSNCNFRVVSPSGKITDTALQEGHEFNVRMPERPEKVRWIQTFYRSHDVSFEARSFIFIRYLCT